MLPPNDLDTLGKRLKWIRECVLREEARPLSRRLIRLAGGDKKDPRAASHTAIANYEKDRREPTLGYLRTMAALGGVRAGWLAFNEGAPVEIEEETAAGLLGLIGALVDDARVAARVPPPAPMLELEQTEEPEGAEKP